MNFTKSTLLMAALALGLGFTSCSDDEDAAPSFSEQTVTNAEMRAFLEGKGYQFNEAGNLLMDEKVMATTSLDLTGSKLTDLKDLVLFPNLKDVDLSDNGYGPAFDFATVPAQIESIDLTGNEIYDYNNLIKVDIATNGEETITNLRDLTKLYLPDEAKNNTTDLVRYYRQNNKQIVDGTIDMQMEDENGNLAKYNTLRNIPDAALRAHLQKQYSTIFTPEGQLDLSKRLSDDEKLNILVLNPYLTENYDKIANLEGVQYIINNLYWEGTTITMQLPEAKELPAIKVSSFVTSLYLSKLNAKILDLSGAEKLAKVSFTEINGIETFDLRGSKVWGQRGFDVESKSGSKLSLLGCKDLKNVYFPEAEVLRASTLNLEGLPVLEKCDITKFSFILNLTVGNVPASYELVYPNITEFAEPPMDGINFACSNSTYALQATKDFIEKYKSYDGKRLIFGNNLSYDKEDEAFWR